MRRWSSDSSSPLDALSHASPIASCKKAVALRTVASARATSSWALGRSASTRLEFWGVFTAASALNSSTARSAIPIAVHATPAASRP